MAPATRGTKRPRKIAAIEEGESPIVQARPSASTSRRKGVKSDRHELDENSGESTDEECVRKKRKKRISVSTRSKKDQYDFWILDENAATNALSCLASIATLPSFCPTAATIRTLEGPSSDGRFTFTHGSIVTSCTHLSTTESLTGIAYGGCAALSYYDLYWSPQLGCLVSLERETIVLTDDLPSVISESGHGTDDCNKNALAHISEHFPMESKDALMKKWRSMELIHPIPGLPNAEVRGKCTKCGFYTAGSITHATKFNCSGKITRDKLSILLLPKTPGREIRIDLQIPDHRPVEASNYNKPKLEQEERSVLAAGPELPTTREERLIVGWMDKTTSWGRGISAPKLKASTGCDGKFYFEARGTKYSCEHGEDAAPPSQSEYYTGCAVLTYLKLYYSPVLQGIVAPGRGYLLDYGQLKTLVKSRTHGLSDDTILNHVTESFAVQFNPATAFQETVVSPGAILSQESSQDTCANRSPKPPTAYTIRLWSGVTVRTYATFMTKQQIEADLRRLEADAKAQDDAEKLQSAREETDEYNPKMTDGSLAKWATAMLGAASVQVANPLISDQPAFTKLEGQRQVVTSRVAHFVKLGGPDGLGLRRMAMENALLVIIDERLIAKTSLTKNPSEPLKQAVFKKEPGVAWEMMMADGSHRQAAARELLKEAQKLKLSVMNTINSDATSAATKEELKPNYLLLLMTCIVIF
ncbi:hypothetical protein NMY22_g8033 [Coprinellus aureogranulatus]|nr:hypothetical protein NMY22_g8033 [Coprinellus aureogranulatus]